MNNDTPADAITQGIDVFAERQAFEAWWKQWVPDGTMPSPTSHIFDAWLASARHRTTSLAAQDGLVDALRSAEVILSRYADYLESISYHELEMHPYIPSVQQARDDVQAALASIEVKS